MATDAIRNVVLVGHGGTGKTTLAEALLFAGGATTRIGRVEDGTTVSDFEPEEIEKGISLSLSLTPYEWADHRINLIDTPGYPAFIGEAKAAMRAADLALFVVSAVDGVEVQHQLLWQMAGEEGLARAIVITKLDRERADFDATLQQLKELFGKSVAPLHVPIGSEADFMGIAEVVTEHAFTYDGTHALGREGELPPGLQARVHEVHAALVEAVVESDDELLERYLEHGEEPSPPQLIAAFHAAIVEGSAFPVLCAVPTRFAGMDLLSDFFVRFAPKPEERRLPVIAGALEPRPDGPAVAYVFKTIADPYMGRVSLFRVYAGSISIDQELVTSDGSGKGGRLHNVFYLQGKEHRDIGQRLVAGDIAAVAKLETISVGDTLVTAGNDVRIEPVEMPPAVMSFAIFPRSQADEEKLSASLQKVLESDPTLSFERHPETNESVLSGLGDMHLEVAVERLRRRYGVDVELRTPTVPYREAITASVEVEGKHKKQSGGRGQYGVVKLRLEPAVRGSGYEFVDAVVGGAIPRQFISAVDRGVREGLQRGLVAGFPVVDVRCTVFDGKYHSVDSDEMSFRMAAIAGVKAAGERLHAVLLEPVMTARILVPEQHMGDVIGDITAKRGQVLGMDFEDDHQVVTVHVPLAEMQRYAIDLRQITHGRGTFSMEFDHYDEVPPHEAAKIIAGAAEQRAPALLKN